MGQYIYVRVITCCIYLITVIQSIRSSDNIGAKVQHFLNYVALIDDIWSWILFSYSACCIAYTYVIDDLEHLSLLD